MEAVGAINLDLALPRTKNEPLTHSETLKNFVVVKIYFHVVQGSFNKMNFHAKESFM